MDYKKIKNKDKLKILNNLIVKAEKDKIFMSSDKFIKYDKIKQFNHIESIKKKMIEIEDLNREINELIDYAPDLSNKLYLSEIIEIEKPIFGDNNLILAPPGSGKSTFILEHLIENKEQTILMLVSNNSLKDSLAPLNNEDRKELGNRMFTTQNEAVYGDKLYKIHLMTFSEFGERIYVDNSFLKNIKQIFCDEIHSLPEYINYGTKSNGGLMHAQRILFNTQEGIQIFYFTATNQNLLKMEKEHPGTLSCVKTFDYREHPDIRKYIPRVTREITHIEQMRQYLQDRKKGFEYYNYKGMAFSRTIEGLKSIEKIVTEEGYNPLVLWSIKNEKYELSEEQIRARNELLATNKIPEPYNFFIFNSAMQEGWDLKDSSVKLAIMNTTNETEFVQALGRLRRDVDLLVYRTNDRKLKSSIEVPKHYIDKNLTTKMKQDLCDELNIIGVKGTPIKWTTMRKQLVENGYNVRDAQIRINKVRTKVSIITK